MIKDEQGEVKGALPIVSVPAIIAVPIRLGRDVPDAL
jgi:hypothetical protein